MSTAFVPEYPVELAGKIDPLLYRRLEQIFRVLSQLREFQRVAPVQTQRAVQRQLQLLGVLREPLVGQEAQDPSLATAATVPGTITDLTASGGSNLTVTVTSSGPGNSNRNINIVLSATPSFTTVNVSGHYEVGGTQVVGAQGAAIPDAAGGATIDVEGRAATNAILAFLRTWGAIAP